MNELPAQDQEGIRKLMLQRNQETDVARTLFQYRYFYDTFCRGARVGTSIGSITRTPGVDSLHILGLATTLKNMDPGVLEYHAGGRAETFLEGFDLDSILNRIRCPVLLLQGNPSLGGMMTDKAVRHVLSVLPGAVHALLEGSGHDLGMDTWQVAPLLRTVSSFLEAL
jgi:pimeloyl-ACP methyl ester carboxylesterase